MNCLKEVELVSTGVYLPGKPILFDDIEEMIGYLHKAPPRIQKMIERLRPYAKELIGIEQCHFAIDPRTKTLTDTNTSMTVKAIQTALRKANVETKDIDCILLANPMPDYQTPPTTTLIQQELGIEKCAEMEVHSNCTGITKVLQIAFDALRVGRYKTVAIAYSQLSSSYLRSSYLNHEKVKKENLLLRWFLSDSASAIILRSVDELKAGIKVKNVYNESLGGKLKPAMWTSVGGAELDLLKLYDEGTHHLAQDYNAVVGEVAENVFVEGFKRMTAEFSINTDEINHILTTIPSTKLFNKAKEGFLRLFSIPDNKWFSNIEKKGYSGASSVVIGLDEMIDKHLFRPGDLLVAITIESSKWMFGGVVLQHF
jgi:3-oxoacyl-[acyl-carrier-protein] synthase-3